MSVISRLPTTILNAAGWRKQRGSILRRHVGDQVAEAVDFQHHAAHAALARGLGPGRGEAHVIFDLVAELVRIDLLGQIGRHRGKHVARMKSVAHRLRK